MRVKILESLRWLRSALLVSVLVVALSMLNFVLGCDKDKEDPAPLYGPPPDEMGQDDVDLPSDIYQEDDVQPRVYYGPVRIDAQTPDIDKADVVPQDAGPGPDMAWYGMPISDAVDSGATDSVEEPPDAVADEMPRAYYGPMPVDVVEDVADPQPDAMQTFYGPAPVDITPSVDAISEDVAADAVDQEAMFYYGPQPPDPQK
jgi:hypothetical protein